MQKFFRRQPKLTRIEAIAEIDRCLDGHNLLIEIDEGIIKGQVSELYMRNEAEVVSLRDQRVARALRKSGFLQSRKIPSFEEFQVIKQGLEIDEYNDATKNEKPEMKLV